MAAQVKVAAILKNKAVKSIKKADYEKPDDKTNEYRNADKNRPHRVPLALDLDSNDDGVFDSKDTRFTDVRIWRDLNQDGIASGDVAARRSLLAWLRVRAFAPAFGAMLGLGVAGGASAGNTSVISHNPESGPAVSELNGKLSAFGGLRDQKEASQDGFGGLTGSWSMPLGHLYGAQFDGLFSLRDGDALSGAGVHLFWRDPGQGLLGVTGSWVGWDADRKQGGYTDMFRIGGEGELYFDHFTFAGQTGVQFGDNTDDGSYGRADLKYYATPNLALKLGAEYNEQVEGLGRIGFEFQPGYAGIPGLTLFVNASAGDDDYYKVFGGLRIYFGAPKSLRDRHRRDDPENRLIDNAAILGQGKVSQPAPTPTTTPAPTPTTTPAPTPTTPTRPCAVPLVDGKCPRVEPEIS